MFEATGAVGANAAAAASQAVRTPTARRIAHTPSPVPQKLELVETKGNKKTKKKKEKQFEKCREFGMKIHISYFLLPGTEFSFPSVVLPNLSTKKLGRDTQRDGRYNASGVGAGGKDGELGSWPGRGCGARRVVSRNRLLALPIVELRCGSCRLLPRFLSFEFRLLCAHGSLLPTGYGKRGGCAMRQHQIGLLAAVITATTAVSSKQGKEILAANLQHLYLPREGADCGEADGDAPLPASRHRRR